jgi:hypothetical protein
MGLGGFSLYKLIQKERQLKRQQDEQMTLGKFKATVVNSKAWNEEVKVQFKKLSKTDRQKVRDKYFELSKGGTLNFKNYPWVPFEIRPAHNQIESDFGENFLNHCANSADAKDHTLLERAVKKTAKVFWRRFAETESEQDKRSALALQAILGDWNNNVNSVIPLPPGNDFEDALNLIKGNLWYLAKREESVADLLRVLNTVPEALNTEPKAS